MLDNRQLQELLLQSLEHERCGVKVYETAIRCAALDDLRDAWAAHLGETKLHVQILEGVLQKLDIDPERASPSREVFCDLSESLVAVMEETRAAGNPNAAQWIARECVAVAERLPAVLPAQTRDAPGASLNLP
jgi:ferritin-like metal-binding protein YciE